MSGLLSPAALAISPHNKLPGTANSHRRALERDNLRPSLTIARMITKNLGMLLLAIYLILVGIMGLTGMALPFVLPILALVAGILILLGK